MRHYLAHLLVRCANPAASWCAIAAVLTAVAPAASAAPRSDEPIQPVPLKADLGRYLVTRVPGDKHVFKVPSLRNVALTALTFTTVRPRRWKMR